MSDIFVSVIACMVSRQDRREKESTPYCEMPVALPLLLPYSPQHTEPNVHAIIPPSSRRFFFITRCGLLDRAGGRASLKCLCEVKEKGKSEDGDISTRRRKPKLSHAVGASRVHGVMRFGLCAAPIGEVSGPRRDERGYQSARGCHKKKRNQALSPSPGPRT